MSSRIPGPSLRSGHASAAVRDLKNRVGLSLISKRWDQSGCSHTTAITSMSLVATSPAGNHPRLRADQGGKPTLGVTFGA